MPDPRAGDPSAPDTYRCYQARKGARFAAEWGTPHGPRGFVFAAGRCLAGGRPWALTDQVAVCVVADQQVDLAIAADQGDSLSRVKADGLDQRIAQRLGWHRLPIVTPRRDASAQFRAGLHARSGHPLVRRPSKTTS